MVELAVKFVRGKWWTVVFFLALTAGALSVLPVFLIWDNLSDSENNFLLMQQNVYRDEFFQYMPRAREVFDGHFPPTGVYSDEAGPSPLNPLPPLLFSLFLRLFDGDVNGAYLAAQFFFTSLIFLLFFVLGLVIFRSKIYSVFFALVGVLTQIPQLLFRYYDRDYLGIILKKFIPVVRTPISKMYFARLDDPMLTIPFLLAALIFLYLFWVKPRFFTAVLAGLFSGLLAYIYLHYWLFIMVFVAVVFLLAWRCRRDSQVKFRHGLVLTLVLLAVLAPYLLNYLDFSSVSSSADYAQRLGKEEDRFLLWKYLASPSGFAIVVNHAIYIVLGLLVYFYYLRSSDSARRRKGLFFLGLVITMFAVWQIPIVAGFGFALAHFNKPINLAVLIILFDLGFSLLKQIKHNSYGWSKVIVILLIFASVSLISKHIINAGVFLQPPPDQLRSYNFPRELTSSWQWINGNVAGEPKIVSDSLVTSLYFSSYTSSRPYLATGFISALPDAELEKRFYMSNKLFDVRGKVLDQRFTGPPLYDCEPDICFKDTWLNADFGKTRWYLTSANWSKTVFATEPQRALREYENMKIDWSQTGSDFVYYGPWEKQFSSVDFSKDAKLELVYKNALVEIFKIKSDIL